MPNEIETKLYEILQQNLDNAASISKVRLVESDNIDAQISTPTNLSAVATTVVSAIERSKKFLSERNLSLSETVVRQNGGFPKRMTIVIPAEADTNSA